MKNALILIALAGAAWWAFRALQAKKIEKDLEDNGTPVDGWDGWGGIPGDVVMY